MPTFIDDPAFDAQFGRTLNATMRGCGDLGEALAVAARITPHDFASWATEWTAAAEDTMADATTAEQAGDLAGARRAYLRANEYYRQAFFFARTDLDDPVLKATYPAHVDAFRRAVPLLGCATTVLEQERDGVVLNGYLFRPDDSGRPRPTVIAPAGYDSTAENGYSLNAASALDRGMNCLVVEGPGQGGVLYTRRLTLRHDYEAVLTPAVDWLLTQDGVDPDALILFGRSFAGYLAPRAATADHRYAALVCDPAQYDFGQGIRHQVGDEKWQRLQDHDPTLDADLAPMLADPAARNGWQWRMTAHGVDSLSDYMRELSRYTVAGLADRITCPTLALAGEGDFAGQGQLQTFADALTAPVTTHEFTVAEGAGGHCEGLGQDLLDQYAFGWLARTLNARGGAA
ncbi:MAG: alpha/beta hydrolase family protein [Pseudonocardia sp.]